MPFRFGMRDVWFWLSWFAVFFLFATQFGMRNEFFWAAVIFLVSIWIVTYLLRRFLVVATVVVLVAMLGFLFYIGPSYAYYLWIALPIGCLWLGRSVPRRTFLRVFATSVLISLVPSLVQRDMALRALRATRVRLPIVDYRESLVHLGSPLANSDSSTEERWTKLEKDWDDNGPSFRLNQLQTLHSRKYADFISSPGAGIARLAPFLPERLQPLRLSDVYLSEERTSSDAVWPRERQLWPGGHFDKWEFDFRSWSRPRMWREDLDEVPNAWEKYPFAYSPDEADFHLHFAAIQNFAYPGSLGYSSEQAKAAGFTSHGFHHPAPDIESNEAPNIHYRIRQLQLVSLLQQKSPFVYVTDKLPSMDVLDAINVPTRELDDFETRAMRSLCSGADLESDKTDGTIRMLGAVRALPRCTECHGGKPGDLLGAFSYKLQRLEAEP